MNQKPSPLHRASEWIVDHYRLFFVVFAALLVFSAVASGWVKVENDVAAYLPADSETRQGLDIMEQEFRPTVGEDPPARHGRGCRRGHGGADPRGRRGGQLHVHDE